MSQKHMLTDADILTITEIVSGCMETVMVSINELKADVTELKADVAILKKNVSQLKKTVRMLTKDVTEIKADIKHLSKQVNHINDGQDVIRIDLVNVHRQLDYVEMAQADRINDKD